MTPMVLRAWVTFVCAPIALCQSATFDIPVDLLLRMQILQALEDFSQDRSDLGLIQSSRLHLKTGIKREKNKHELWKMA